MHARADCRGHAMNGGDDGAAAEAGREDPAAAESWSFQLTSRKETFKD